MEYNIRREIKSKIKADFYKGKVIVLVGPRQVGKTTLIRQLLCEYGEEKKILELNADNPSDRASLDNKDLVHLSNLVKSFDVIFIDEAQKVPSIGNTLKLMVDHYGEAKQIIATGSSSLNLLTNTQEPLTGRKFVHELFSLSVREISSDKDQLEIRKQLENLLIHGAYPGIYLSGIDEKKRLLNELTQSYLYQDILELEQIRNAETITKLLQALALQIGSEVSFNELASLVGLDVKTVQRYVDLLQKNYVIFKLPPYYNNKRKSLSKLNKIYFYDLGIRNALINNFNSLDLRNDVGALWENFVVVERMKYRNYVNKYVDQYFWKTYGGTEVDLVEQHSGVLDGFEIKYGESLRSQSAPRNWSEIPNTSYSIVNRTNFLEFLGF